MIDFVVTFLSLFLIDIFYTYYLRAVSEGKALLASSWSIIVTILGAFVVINYTTNHMLLIPAALGAFCGTWVGMKLRARM
jgi:uncharacterized membrane protein YfcA